MFIEAQGVRLSLENRMEEDGVGIDATMSIVLSYFNVMNCACSLGLTERTLSQAKAHLAKKNYTPQVACLRDLPTIRAYLAKAQIRYDQCAAFWGQTIGCNENADKIAPLRVLECKASGAEAAIEVTSTCMRICGGCIPQRTGHRAFISGRPSCSRDGSHFRHALRPRCKSSLRYVFVRLGDTMCSLGMALTTSTKMERRNHPAWAVLFSHEGN